MHDVALMRQVVGGEMGAVPSGGFERWKTLKNMAQRARLESAPARGGENRRGDGALRRADPMATTRNPRCFASAQELLDSARLSRVTAETLDLDGLLVSQSDRQYCSSTICSRSCCIASACVCRFVIQIGHRDEVVRSRWSCWGEAGMGAAATSRTPVLVL